ncbi:MAG TPA: prepilin peptidase [Candidatus Blautia merdipullorum]|nr:prepilin peptidase [Candidatus Blautia merdipullorum]
MELEWAANIIMLAFCSVQDIREKEISLWKLQIYGFLILGIFLSRFFIQKNSLFSLLEKGIFGLIPGLLFLFLAKASKEAVGYGDGIILLFIGISIGFWQCLGVLFTALLGIFLAAAMILILAGRKKNVRIPFLPFLLTGMAGGYFWLRN